MFRSILQIHDCKIDVLKCLSVFIYVHPATGYRMEIFEDHAELINFDLFSDKQIFCIHNLGYLVFILLVLVHLEVLGDS